ncbi:hypothetical protein FACS1894164_06970 [Spirochaetia bacterium]|nr:hypothetical protein FACS1894164_06970 [Spirochaetia bacterium]
MEKESWHPAFYGAIKLELEAYRDSLEFITEYQLNKEPLIMDLLIIKKPADLVITKNIATIFKKENIVEYKSPEDYVSIADFYKVYGYAYLYISLNNIPVTDVTITFVETRHPRDVLKHLSTVRGYSVEETSSGIYRISGDIIPIQIIESKKLPEAEDIWLKNLSNDLNSRRLRGIFEESMKRGKDPDVETYLYTVLQANPEIVKEIKEMSKLTLEEVLEDWITEWKTEGLQKGRQEEKLETARKFKLMGLSVEQIAAGTDLSIEVIENLK